jgi:transcriptional antiterminator RfaH
MKRETGKTEVQLVTVLKSDGFVIAKNWERFSPRFAESPEQNGERAGVRRFVYPSISSIVSRCSRKPKPELGFKILALPITLFDMVAVENWFCLRSQPKSEHIAAAHLRNMDGVAVFLPRVRFQRSTKQGLAWVTEALFPGYLFARFDWHLSLRQVQAARGVSGVVHFGARWPVIDAAVIEDLKQAVGAEELHVIPTTLQPGDAVEIAEGAMRGLQATVSRVMPSRERVAVLLEFLGRQTTIEVPANFVIKEGNVREGMFPPET